jgi:hypothetical protein
MFWIKVALYVALGWAIVCAVLTCMFFLRGAYLAMRERLHKRTRADTKP